MKTSLKLFFVFAFIGFTSNALAFDFSLKGNPVASFSVGRYETGEFFIRNFEGTFSNAYEYFFLKAQFDVSPLSIINLSPRYSTGATEITSQKNILELFRIKETYISTRGLPYIRLRFGKLFGEVGMYNKITFWERNFVERPAFITEFFGRDGFIDNGIEFSFLPPLPWYLEVLVQVLDGNSPSFSSLGSWDFVYVGRIKNVISGDEFSGGFGASVAAGRNYAGKAVGECDFRGRYIVCLNSTDFFGGDGFFKWQRGKKYVFVGTEYLLRRKQEPGIRKMEGGLVFEISSQPFNFFAAGVRPSLFGIPGTVEGDGKQKLPSTFDIDFSLTFIPVERVKLRFQWSGNFGENTESLNTLFLQGIFDIM